jgi:putative transposase
MALSYRSPSQAPTAATGQVRHAARMPHGYLNGPGSRSLRLGRCSTSGQVFLVTFTTFARTRLFADFDLACVACRALTDERLWYASRLLAWVLMPDHWHGLIELGESESISRVVQRLKANTSRRVRETTPRSTRVWAGGFHDRALRHEDHLVHLARYLVLNPVRAGLVRRVGDYPFWDALWITKRES